MRRQERAVRRELWVWDVVLDREAAPLPPSRFSFHLCAHRAGALPSSVLLICPKVLHTFLICSPSPWRSGAASILPSPRANSARGRSIHRGKVMKRGPGICKVRKGIWEEKPLQIKAFKLEYKLKSSSILFANLEGDYSIRVRTRHTPGIWCLCVYMSAVGYAGFVVAGCLICFGTNKPSVKFIIACNFSRYNPVLANRSTS